MKKFVLFFLWLVFVYMPVWAEELNPQQFVQAFSSALQSKDDEKILQLLQYNTETVKKARNNLLRAQGKDEQAKQKRALGELLNNLLNAWEKAVSSRIPELDQFLERATQAYHQSDYQTTLAYWQEGLVRARKLNNPIYIIQFLSNIGSMYRDLTQYTEALKSYEEMLSISRGLNSRFAEGDLRYSIGVLYNNLAQYDKALEYCKQALQIHKAIHNRQGEGHDFNCMGMIYHDLSQYQRALEYYKQALAIYREINDRSGESAAFNNIGEIYRKRSQYVTALEYYQKGLAIHHKLDERSGMAADLFNNLGLLYSKIGQYSKALEYYQQALSIDREINNRNGEGDDLGNIGEVYQNLGQYEKALEYHQKALAIHREIDDLRGESADLTNLGIVYGFLGQGEKALESHEKALKIRRQIKNHHGIAESISNVGRIYVFLGQLDKALEKHEQALAIFKEIGDPGGEGTALYNIALGYNNRGQYIKALEYYEKTLENIESLRIGLNKRELSAAIGRSAGMSIPEEALYKQSFMQNKLGVYDELITLHQTLDLQHPNQGHDEKAFHTFERKQGRIFLEQMGESGARRYAGVPQEIPQRETELDAGLAQTRKRLSDERAKLITEQNRDLIQNLEQQEQELLTEQERLQTRIREDYPAYHALRYPQPVELQELQQNVLRPGEMLLVYAVMKESTVLWLISKDQFKMFTLPLNEEQLTQQVSALRQNGVQAMLDALDTARERKLQGVRLKRFLENAVTDSLPDFLETSHKLYQTLLPPEARKLLSGAKTLFIVPTGALYQLPFEALVTNPDEEQAHYLLEDYPVVYLSSASLLKTLREAENRRELEQRQPLLAFADPLYPACDSKTEPEPAGGDEILALRTRAYQSITTRDGDQACFPPLPETAEEARQIAAQLEADLDHKPPPLYLRKQASKPTLLALNEQQKLDDYRYILFAGHAVLPEEVSYIRQPALVLSHTEAGEEGFLTMGEVFGLQLNADLVMLSACNTGGGEHIRGEGVSGLTRAFMYAGTPAVSVTLWEVESLSAKRLSTGLFDKLQNNGLAESLRQAKLDMLRGENEIHRHPYFWAPLVVFGDGNGQGKPQNVE